MLILTGGEMRDTVLVGSFVSAATRDKFKHAAFKQGRSVSNLMRLLIEAEIKRMEKEK